jgi:putative salt-induced outer membrane protein YdiY
MLSAVVGHAQRRDVVVMKNGDTISGKVRKLELGQLFIETPYVVNQIPLDWLQVERVESTAQFQVEMSNGRRIVGRIEKTPIGEGAAGDFTISNPTMGAVLVRAADVVGIQSQKSNFWRQIKGSVGLGFSYDSGSSETALNINARSSYTTTRLQVGGSLNSSISGQSGTERTNRQEISANSSIFLSRHAFVGNISDFLISNQQGINLRQTYGGGYGRYFLRTNTTQLSWLGGAVYVREAYNPADGQSPNDQNCEGLLRLDYNWFRFNISDLKTTLQIFPGISDAGRVRTNLNTNYSIKFTHDLGLQLNLWDSFDSRPLVSADKNELGISTSFNLTF